METLLFEHLYLALQPLLPRERQYSHCRYVFLTYKTLDAEVNSFFPEAGLLRGIDLEVDLSKQSYSTSKTWNTDYNFDKSSTKPLSLYKLHFPLTPLGEKL
jgi:hypothetical protein